MLIQCNIISTVCEHIKFLTIPKSINVSPTVNTKLKNARENDNKIR